MESYTGDVTPGGPPQVRDLGCLTLTKVAVDPQMSNNAYLLRCQQTGDQVLVDAADDAGTLLDLVGDGGLVSVVTTHQHWDHHRALAEVVERTGAQVLVGEPDADAVTEQTGVPVDVRLEHGDRVAIGSCELEVIAIAGHTPGSVALLHRAPGGVGAAFGDAAPFAQLINDVEEKVFATLPDETHFYPGHGGDGVLGDQRPPLAEWRERGW